MGESIHSCSDFQALIPVYREGRLPEARALLLKDHLHECVACRKVFAGATQARMPVLREGRRLFRWVVVGCLGLVACAAAWVVVDQFVLTPRGPNVVQSANGTLYRVGGQPVAAGQEVPLDAEIRTAKDSGAVVRLRDGSVVRMGPRSALSVTAAGKDLTVHLGEGSISVQAAKRRSGHLNVAAPDLRVAASGSTLSVDSGTKGSRVSVTEGELPVGEKVLHTGEQFSSSPSITPGEDSGTRIVLPLPKAMADILAPPSPIGALDFVSPEASHAAAFAIQDPARVIREVLKHPELSDLAGPLGGNFAVAVDGPLLPKPSWKLAVEVYDPAKLQSEIQKLVETRQGAQLTQESMNGRTYYKAVIPELKVWGEANYVFVDGYLLAAPSRSLLDRAIQYRSTGYTLPRSSAFQALLPKDQYTNFSGMVYYTGPTLITICVEEGRVRIASTAKVFAQNPASLLGALKFGK